MGLILPLSVLRAKIPTGDLILADGRRLVFQSEHRIPVEYGVSVGARWRTLAPDESQRLAVTASMDVTDKWGALLHVSLSYPDHLPSWDDVKLVRAAFYRSDIDVMMVLPRAEDYVNIHPFTFHMWQTPQVWGIR